MTSYLPLPTPLFARVLLAACVFASAAAQAKELDPETRNYVIASCSGDAYRLCPQSLGSEEQAVSCMRAKRRQLGHVCRVAYDKVARTLAE